MNNNVEWKKFLELKFCEPGKCVLSNRLKMACARNIKALIIFWVNRWKICWVFNYCTKFQTICFSLSPLTIRAILHFPLKISYLQCLCLICICQQYEIFNISEYRYIFPYYRYHVYVWIFKCHIKLFQALIARLFQKNKGNQCANSAGKSIIKVRALVISLVEKWTFRTTVNYKCFKTKTITSLDIIYLVR
jgi:hypothetical protein